MRPASATFSSAPVSGVATAITMDIVRNASTRISSTRAMRTTVITFGRYAPQRDLRRVARHECPYAAAMTYVDLRPRDVRLVRVLIDDQWRDGQLEAYRRDRDGTWRGFVRWSEGVGLTRIAWLAGDRIGPVASVRSWLTCGSRTRT